MTSPADLVVAAALAEWRRVVRDAPSGHADILRYYHQGLGWTWQRYPAPGAQWCGAFAAFCWRAAGLDRSVRYKRLASVYRITRWCSGEQGRLRAVLLDAIQPGDILLIGDNDGPSHIGIAIAAPDESGQVETIEGNSVATLGDGTRGEGVVRRLRPPLEVRPGSRFIHFAIRPLPADLTMPAGAGAGA
jgi:uncharacterized protein YijF (DUF1287 family)